jgi:hypothetical protein
MSKQIFKTNIKIADLFQLLDDICSKNDKHYVINNAAYKRGIFTGDIVKFIEFCTPYYHVSKRYYLERKLSYKSFTTILRQICNCNNITYTSQVTYDKSNYEIVYYIYF